MSKFSELLKECINVKKISVSRIAAELGIDRTLFHKYMSGARMPKKYQDVIRIGNVMALTPQQMKELQQAYYISLYGEKNYRSFYNIKRILEGIHDLRVDHTRWMDIPDEKFQKPDSPPAANTVYSGRLQVEQALVRFLYEHADEKRDVMFRMIIQPDQEELMRVILGGCSGYEGRIEHIICMDSDRNNNENLERILFILAFNFGKLDYQSYYYYEDVKVYESIANFIPNIVLAEDAAFLCSRGMEECLVLQQSDEMAYYTAQYEKVRRISRPLGIARKNAEPFQSSLDRMYKEAGMELHLGYAPCLLVCIDEQMIYQHLQVDDDLKEKITQHLTAISERTCETKKGENYFSEKGLRDFMETGIIPNYPEEIYRSVDQEERMIILQRMIEFSKSGESISYYMAAEERLSMENSVVIYVERERVVKFHCLGKDFGKTVEVEEPGIRDTIYLFTEFAKNNDWFYSREETTERIEAIYEEYKTKWSEGE